MKTNESLKLKKIPNILNDTKRKILNNKKIFYNMGWLIADKIIRMGIGVFVGIWVARYLGPSQYGILNYALAIVSLMSITMSLGLDSLVTRMLIQKEYPKNIALGTAFFLRLISSILMVMITFAIGYFIKLDNKIYFWIILILSTGTIIQSFDVIDFWFQSQVKSKYIAWARNIACIFSAVLRVACILLECSVTYFAIIVVIELLIGTLIYIGIYQYSEENILSWRFSINCAKSYFKESIFLLLNGIIVILIFKTDQIMLKILVDDAAVGIYAVASHITEIFYFVPMIISASCLPKLLSIKQNSYAQYEMKYQQLFSCVTAVALVIALLITTIAPYGVNILYGYAYEDSVYVLYLYVWTAIFVFSGHLRSQWLINEKKTKYNMYSNLVGFMSNILLNLILIPHYSYFGAAVATVFSNFLSHYFFGFFFKEVRNVFKMQSKGLLLKGLFKKKKYTI